MKTKIYAVKHQIVLSRYFRMSLCSHSRRCLMPLGSRVWAIFFFLSRVSLNYLIWPTKLPNHWVVGNQKEFQNFLEYHRLNWLCQTENQKMEPLLGRHRNHLYPVNSDSKKIVVSVHFPAEERLNFYRRFKAVNPVKSKILQIHLIILKIILSFKCTSKSSYSSCISEKK